MNKGTYKGPQQNTHFSQKVEQIIFSPTFSTPLEDAVRSSSVPSLEDKSWLV